MAAANAVLAWCSLLLTNTHRPTMLAQRLLVAIIIIPVAILFAWLGGWFLAVALAALLGFAAWEYWHMFAQGGYRPSLPVLVGGTALLLLMRQASGFEGSDWLISVFVLVAMTVQVAHQEKGLNTSALDFNITLGGILYLGWLGGYLVSIRNLPEGLWWVLLVVPAAGIADSAAFFVGRAFGKHKISKRVSPNKTWEGYFGGVIAAALGTMLLAMLWNMRTPAIEYYHGLFIGMVIGALTILGDLGESMLKRGMGVKDASQVLPGHGGIMDRIDSWLWAAPIGYYMIHLLWL